MSTDGRKLRLAVYKFSSCDGCQLSLLNLEDELLALVGAVDVAYFLEARTATQPGPYDIGLVEGAISTPEEAERIFQIRSDCEYLVAIGACATAGGIQALRNWADVDEFVRAVYAKPSYIETLETATPIAAHTFVDFELRGCPVNKYQLVELIAATVAGRTPEVPTYSQCMECKRAGTTCVMVSEGKPCLGPVTQAGCGNLCPSCDRGCYGCFGPMEATNTAALARQMKELGTSSHHVRSLFHNFNAGAPEFAEEGKAHD